MRVTVSLAAVLILAACTAAPPPADPPATIARSHQFEMTSAAGRTYVIQVAAPIDPLPEGERAPAIYVTDGNWYFGVATDTVRMHRIGGGLPPAYVIAIGYDDPVFRAVAARRETDLAHNRFHGPEGEVGGGGGEFLAFLNDELKPEIERRFPVDPARSVLTGQSLGGLFAANVILSAPESFSGYLIGSPSLWADSTVLPKMASFTSGGGQRVFVGVGGGESEGMRKGTTALAQALSAPSTGLVVEHQELAQHSHASMAGAWFATGLFYLLGPR